MKLHFDANYHTHTTRCGHAIGTDEQYVISAIEAGFKVLGFSDHVPFNQIESPRDRMSMTQLDDYLSSIAALKEKYVDQIDIKVGFESEYYPEYHAHYEALLKRSDYLIIGQHYIALNSYGYDDYCSDEDVEIYTEQVVAAMRSGYFAFLAHPDYFMIGRSNFNALCEKAAHRIAEVAVETNTPLEINLNGFRHGKKWINESYEYAYPYLSFWAIVSQYPVRVVYNYDAHAPLTLHKTDYLHIAQDILKDLDLNMELNFRIL